MLEALSASASSSGPWIRIVGVVEGWYAGRVWDSGLVGLIVGVWVCWRRAYETGCRGGVKRERGDGEWRRGMKRGSGVGSGNGKVVRRELEWWWLFCE